MKRLVLGLVPLLFAVHAAAEVAWPQKPMRILVPGGPGGVTDVRARWLAGRLQEELGQPVVVEDRAGAGGNIGMELGAHSAPDGYTFVIVHQGTMAVNPHLYSNPGYDPLHDFTPLTRLGHGPLMLAVNPSLPVHSVAELVALAKTRRLSFGSPGLGTPPHLAVEIFERDTGIEATHVPYRHGGQSSSDLIAGHVDFEIEGLTVLMPHVKAGRLRAIAITGTERNPACPDVPTMRESGVPGYEYTGWVGIALPAGTPPDIVHKAYEAIAKVMRSRDAREWFGAAAADPTPDTPEAFAAVIRAEYDRFGKLIRDAGIKAE
jgi:tripartite-type tricarboxylate transporter receptor subunit TctC